MGTGTLLLLLSSWLWLGRRWSWRSCAWVEAVVDRVSFSEEALVRVHVPSVAFPVHPSELYTDGAYTSVHISYRHVTTPELRRLLCFSRPARIFCRSFSIGVSFFSVAVGVT